VECAHIDNIQYQYSAEAMRTQHHSAIVASSIYFVYVYAM